MQPEQLGPFLIGQVLGRGGMGAVYKGVHEKTGEEAAVKVLLGNLEDDSELRLRFEAEIDTLKRLRHPNIVRLFGFGEEQGLLYYVMELVDGPSLHQEIKRQRLFQWHEAAKIGLEMCMALKHGHDRGITHRDIKPANILLEQRGSIKLSDYGIAHFFGGQRLTEVNSVVGTLEYMSPEQSLANPVGPRSDLYSLGAVLYSLLAGKPPFAARNLAEIVRKHQRNVIESIRAVRLDVPDELEAIILDLLKIRPEERPGNAYLVAKRFQSLMQALVGPPEQILVRPMTAESPTAPPSGPPKIPYKGDDEYVDRIAPARGLVVENGIIDLGGIVDHERTDPIRRDPVEESRSETPDAPSPAGKKAEASDAKESTGSLLAESFGRPAPDLPGSQTVVVTGPSAEKTMQEVRPKIDEDDFSQPTRFSDESSDEGPLSDSSPTRATRAITKKQGKSETPNSDSTVYSIQPAGGDRIRHGELYLDDAPAFRRSKDEPIPEYNVFNAADLSSPDEADAVPDENPPEENPPEDAASERDELTIDGIETGHRPEPIVPDDGAAPQPELYGLQGRSSSTEAGAENRRTMAGNATTTSRFVSVTDQDYDYFDEDDRRSRPIISLQTVFASCCLILIGLITFYVLQPAPPDLQYERIVKGIESNNATETDWIKAIRRAEKDIDSFLMDYSHYPKADQLRFYKEQLELDKLERDAEKRLQSTDSKMMIPVQRAYIEAMGSVRTDPERTIRKLKALIDLFQTGTTLSADETNPTDADSSDGMPRTSRRRLSRGSRDEDFVFLATRQLQRLERDIDTINAEQIGKLRLRLEYAQSLDETYPERAAAIRAAVIELYQDKDWASDVVEEARKDLDKHAK